MGSVKDIPPGYISRTILAGSTIGIRNSVQEWGRVQQKWHSRDNSKRDAAHEMRYLGYYTDAGAFYYYNTEPGMNYDQTFEYIKYYNDALNFPVRFTQYDSWFYPHGTGNGVLEWEFRTDKEKS